MENILFVADDESVLQRRLSLLKFVGEDIFIKTPKGKLNLKQTTLERLEISKEQKTL